MMSHVDPTGLVPSLSWGMGQGEATVAGLSRVEQILLKFQSHEEAEQRTLREYQDALEKIEHPATKFLLNLIRLDEERHRQMLHVISSTFQGDLMWRRSDEGLQVVGPAEPEREETLGLVKRFIQVEKEGIREFKGLLRETRGMYEGIFSMLLRVFIRDSEKHVMILRVLQQYLRKR